MNLPIELPKTLRTEDEIVANWIGDISKPLVSVCCTTYNHAPYVEETIKGFLIQVTNFPVEILIHDDASNDGTQEILEDYQRRYPKIITLILQTENQYSKGSKPRKFLMNKCHSDYIAYCEGDDYWTDPKKLQIQVDFLESNPEFVITGHDAFVIDEAGRLIKSSKLPTKQKRAFQGAELSAGNAWVLTLSWVYRNVIKEFAPERSMVINEDNFIVSILGAYGSSHFHTDIRPAAYRIHSGGVWSSLSEDRKLDNTTNTLFWMYRYYKRVGRPDLASVFYGKFLNCTHKRATLGQLSLALLKKITRWSFLKLLIKRTLRRTS